MKTRPLSERIAIRRRETGQPREALALLWDVSVTSVRHWELGLTEPREEDRASVEAWLGGGR